MMIRYWNGLNTNFFSCSPTRLYVVIIFDAYIIMDGILEIQTRFFRFLYLTEGTDIVVNLIDDDVWEAGDELTVTKSDESESQDWLYF